MTNKNFHLSKSISTIKKFQKVYARLGGHNLFAQFICTYKFAKRFICYVQK